MINKTSLLVLALITTFTVGTSEVSFAQANSQTTAQEKKQAEEKAKAEADKKAEEQKKKDEANRKIFEDAKQAARDRHAADQKKKDDEAKAAAERAAADQKKQAEAQKAALDRQAADERRRQEAVRAEQQRLDLLKREAAASAAADQKKQADAQKATLDRQAADEKRRQEAVRLEKEKQNILNRDVAERARLAKERDQKLGGNVGQNGKKDDLNEFQRSRENVRKLSEESLKNQPNLTSDKAKRIQDIQRSTRLQPTEKIALLRHIEVEGTNNAHGVARGYSEDYASGVFERGANLRWTTINQDLVASTSPVQLKRSRNITDVVPGALIVWTGQGRGHVAVVTRVSTNTVEVSEMNFGRMLDAKGVVTEHFNQVTTAQLSRTSFNRPGYQFKEIILPRTR